MALHILGEEITRLREQLTQARLERQRDITEHKRLLNKLEAVSFAHAEQLLLLARIEALARAGDSQGVVEAIVRQTEKGSQS